MENKTIKHLNTKTWYRFVKVIFILLFLAVIAIGNLFVFSNGDFKQVSLDKTKITCTYGEKKSFTASDVNLYSISSAVFSEDKFNYKNFFEVYGNDFAIRDILNECYSPEDKYYDVFAMQKVYEVWGDERIQIRGDTRPPLTETEKKYLDEVIPRIEGNYYPSGKSEYVDYSVKLFDISLVFDFMPFIKTFLLTNIIILAVFEIIRRAFYYITLGRLRPKKD
jgi:hypothetical protein